MRLSTFIQLAAASALVVAPAIAAAAPLRSGASLPVSAPVDMSVAQRASAPMEGESSLTGVPIVAVLGLFSVVIIIAVFVGRGGG
jgi:hypothetical protein